MYRWLFLGLHTEHVLASAEGEQEANPLYCAPPATYAAYSHFVITTTWRGRFSFTEKETEVQSLIQANRPRSPPSKKQGT